MKLQRVVLVLMGMVLLFAGRSSAQDVKTDYDRTANFGQYKTYSWEQIKTQDQLMVDRIKSADSVDETVTATVAAIDIDIVLGDAALGSKRAKLEGWLERRFDAASLEDKLEAVMFYAEHDAWLPVE